MAECVADNLRARTVRLIREVVRELAIDLRGQRVVTEAATGAYVVTPLIAAVAGADVTAITAASRFGSVDDVRRETISLADELNVADRIKIVSDWKEARFETADIVTNSGHVRPLHAEKISHLRTKTVVPLMYENWEFRKDDLDLSACHDRGVIVAGTNERHPSLRVFDYLGMLAVLGLLRASIPVPLSKLLLISDNPFAKHITEVLSTCHARVTVLSESDVGTARPITYRTRREPDAYDAVVLADTPWAQGANIGSGPSAKYRPEEIGEFRTLIQLWGDVDRDALPGVHFQPANSPKKGHMGILLSELGPDPIVRLQAGGLKVGEVLLKRDRASEAELAYCQVMKPADFHKDLLR